MDETLQFEALNARCGIAGVASIVAGAGGLPKVCISTPASNAEIYLHGAQVTSWRPVSAEEVLFLSVQSHWQQGRAIRGGIPICFPWFRGKSDDPKAPAHGFVRTRQWSLDSIEAAGESVTVTCSTQSDEASRRWWPHEFHLRHRITIGSSLGLELIVKNTGRAPLRFEEALHTYFKVGDARQVRVRGLDRANYLDNTDGNREKLQSGDVAFTAATDNAYLNAHGAAELIDPVLHRVLRTVKTNSATTVVWNPWQQGAALLTDLGDEEWQQMACVEACNILVGAVSLAPDEEHTLCATIALEA